MKKYVLMLVMMFTMCYSFAGEGDTTPAIKSEKFEFNVNHGKLGMFLKLSAEQMEQIDVALDEFSRNLMFAGTMESEKSSNKIVANAIKKNVSEMRYILKDDQFRKYLLLLNITLRNKGFDMTEITE